MNKFSNKIIELNQLFEKVISLVQTEIDYDLNNQNLKMLNDKIKKAHNECKNQTFQIAIVALTKSGKSTFINAILGNEYLPTSNVPETARIVRIIHSKNHPSGLLNDNGNKIEGSTAIFDYLKNLNEQMRQEFIIPSENELKLNAPIKCLDNNEFGNVIFEFLDTPGPNEANAEALKHRVINLLEDVHVIIYLLDYTKLKTDEEKQLIEKIAQRKDLIDKLDRLFFVVNKIDSENRNGLKKDDTIDYVFNILKPVISGITKDKILLVSAEKALLSRLIKNKTQNEKVIADFAKRSFGEDDYEGKTLDDCLPKADKSLDNSQLPHIEEHIISFLFKNRGQILVKGLLERLKQNVHNFYNHIQTAQRTVNTSIEDLEKQIIQIENDIEKIKQSLNDIDKIANNTEHVISEWIEDEFLNFRNEIDSFIEIAFQYKMEQKKSESWLSILKRVLSKASKRIIEKLANPIVIALAESVAEIFTSDEVKVTSRESAGSILLQVNKKIEIYIRDSFNGFRYDLEKMAVAKQRFLFNEFEGVVNKMAREIESKVGKRLNSDLKEVIIDFPADSIDQIHKKIQSQIDSLVNRIETIVSENKPT